MATPTIAPLPNAPDRGDGAVQFDVDAAAWASAIGPWTAEVNVVAAYTADQAVAALAAAVAGNMSALDLTALAGWVIGVNAAGTALEGVELIAPVQATEVGAGVAELATVGEAEAGIDDLAMMTALKVSQAINKRTTTTAQQATTSGTTVDFSSIPAGTTEILVCFDEVSLNGSDHLLVQVGDSVGIEATGYSGGASSSGADTNSTTGFVIYSGSSSRKVSGIMTLRLVDPAANLWMQGHSVGYSGNGESNGGGRKALSGVLTQLRLTRSGGNTFDGGAVNIIYKRS